jgi:hypothetical protein
MTMSHVDMDGSCSRSLTDLSGRGSFHVRKDQGAYCIQYKSLVLQLLAQGTKTKTYETAEIFSGRSHLVIFSAGIMWIEYTT